MDAHRFDIRIAADNRLLVDIRDFVIPLNKITLLFGESGIGKSLIARSVYGLLDPEEFEITINNQPYEQYLESDETRTIRKKGFFVFQEPSSHLNPLLPLRTQLSEGSLSNAPDNREVLTELWKGTDETQIERLLDVYPKPHRPSGGEKQRMFLAMALTKIDLALSTTQENSHGYFVFDEPTGNLDNRSRDLFLSLLFSRFQKRRFTTLLITHDYSMISEVTRTHRRFIEHVSFRELRLHHGALSLKEFQPETYLGWLDLQRRERKANRSVERSNPLICVESDVEIFGRKLAISKDRAGTKPTPLEIFPGTMSYLKAPSGTGKTTLAKLMMGLIQDGRIRIDLQGESLTEKTPRSFWRERIWGKRIALAFQHADEALNPRSSVAEVFHGLPSRTKVTVEDIRSVLGELFDEELTDDFLGKKVANLSGGQKQRVNLLRSLFLDTDVLILDEPLNGLDLETTTRVLAMVREKLRGGKGILIISHNEEIFDAMIPEENVYYLIDKDAIAAEKRTSW